MPKGKKKTATQKRRALKKKAPPKSKGRVGRGKPKGSPPSGLRTKKSSRPRAVPPPPRDIGLLDAVGEVIAVCEDLGQQMRDWADNMPESKQSSSKFEEVDQCATTLEDQAQADPVTPETMSFLNLIMITVQDPTPKRQPRSRSAQLGDARDILGQVLTKLEEFKSADPKEKETADELHSSLQEIEGELDGVDFPGMFG